jgi:hypothetical protein
MNLFLRRMLIGLAVLALPLSWYTGVANAQSASLDFLTKPALIECEPQSSELCFRLQLGFVDDAGKPVNIQLPPASQLTSHIEVQVEGQAIKPFYAAATPGKADKARRPQTTLLLFDISGSMLTADLGGKSRFDAAKSAASEFLQSFSDGQDSVAIVPFASRDVDSTIRAAHFVSTRAEAQRELDGLPRPEARNNTALYSAVRSAVLTLQQQSRVDSENHLILLTDGKNDVNAHAGDDQGMLVGPDGLAAASTAVQQSGADVLPIGLGDRQSIDEVAMARLGTRPPLITFDVDTLHKAFQLRQLPQDGSLTVTLQAPEHLASRTLLAGQIIHFRAKLTLTDGTILVENRHALWVSPPVATPSFEDEASEAEQRAFLANANLGRSSLMLFLRPVFIFAGFAVALAVLWFGVPRLIWSEHYDNRSARPVRPEYWPGVEPARGIEHNAVIRQAPPGFEPALRGGRAQSRTPSEHTVVRPITEFDPNKTRLS